MSGTALAFGLSGQIGRALTAPLLAEDWRLSAVSRQRKEGLPEAPGLSWLSGSLEQPPALPSAPDLVLSLGPLDAFAAWLERAGLARGTRIIAIGSTSVRFKAGSPAAGERAQAHALALAEQRLFAQAERAGLQVTLLRPTLIYGHGLDPGLGRLAALARRWRVCPLPAGATGRRQPLHVDDLAGAVLAALREPVSIGRSYDLPGGECLSFDAMVARYLRRHAPGARLLRLPRWLFSAGLAILVRSGRRPPLGPGGLARVGQDQVVDAGDARRDLGFSPRKFEP